jgi:septum formation protein
MPMAIGLASTGRGGEHGSVAPDLYLASTSPRRRTLLAQAGIPFALCEPGPEYVLPGTDEHSTQAGEPAVHALERAIRKAMGARSPDPSVPVLGVDTVVDLDGTELGKPRSREHAEAMLLALADRDHVVHTAHCLFVPASGFRDTAMAHATVTCGRPSRGELAAYLDSEEWRGKAGSYGIQDGSQHFLALVEGDLDTVVGLHVPAVRALLAAWRSRR